MMILIMGTLQFSLGNAAKAAPLLAEHATRVHDEDGCLHYAFSLDLADPDLVHVSERWATEAFLAMHAQAAHQKAFLRALRAHAPYAIRFDAWDGQHQRNLIGG